jgi:hypothetical protein
LYTVSEFIIAITSQSNSKFIATVVLVCGAAAGALPRPGELLCAACADLVRLPSQPPLARPHTAGVCPLSGVKLELFNH